MNELLAVSVLVAFAVVLVAISRGRTRSERFELWLMALGMIVLAIADFYTLSHTTTMAVTIGGAIIIVAPIVYGLFDRHGIKG